MFVWDTSQGQNTVLDNGLYISRSGVLSISSDKTSFGSSGATAIVKTDRPAVNVAINLDNQTNDYGYVAFLKGSQADVSLTQQNGVLKADKYINGVVAAYHAGDFIYPVGEDGVYAPCKVSANGASTAGNVSDTKVLYCYSSRGTQDFSVAYKADDVMSVSTKGFWLIQNDQSASISLAFDQADFEGGLPSGVTIDDVYIVGWRNGKWNLVPTNKDVYIFGVSSNPVSNIGTIGSLSTAQAIPKGHYTAYAIGIKKTKNPLPISLLNYSAEKDNNTSLLSWVTVSEINNDHFTLYHSTDGENWLALDEIKGNGNSTEDNTYMYRHHTPNEGINYYKLEQTDFDGTRKELGIRSLIFENENMATLEVYPNPAHTYVTLKGVSYEEEILSIVDVFGKMYMPKQYIQSTNGQRITLDLTRFAPGVYVVSTTKGIAKFIKY